MSYLLAQFLVLVDHEAESEQLLYVGMEGESKASAIADLLCYAH